MKNNLRNFIMLVVGGVFFGGASNAFAQPEIPLVGGYNSVETTDTAVVAATDFAVKKRAKTEKSKIRLVAVSRAAQQVVAGMNYQLCLNVETTDRQTKKTAPQTVQAVVYRDLKGKYKLTSWAIAACADPAPPVAAPND